MVMMHGATTSLIDDVYARGYGGIVTNVAWGTDYLQNARAFSSLANCVSHAVDKGMHVWLYDEYGYPSGAAYGQTLKGNPEYEAQGLVPQYRTIEALENASRFSGLYVQAVVRKHPFDGKLVRAAALYQYAGRGAR